MRSAYIPRKRRSQARAGHGTVTVEADDGCPRPETKRSIIDRCKHLLAVPLALFLLLLAALFLLFKGANCHLSGRSMSYQWPRISPFKDYVQRLLRDLRRDTQFRRYAR